MHIPGNMGVLGVLLCSDQLDMAQGAQGLPAACGLSHERTQGQSQGAGRATLMGKI